MNIKEAMAEARLYGRVARHGWDFFILPQTVVTLGYGYAGQRSDRQGCWRSSAEDMAAGDWELRGQAPRRKKLRVNVSRMSSLELRVYGVVLSARRALLHSAVLRLDDTESLGIKGDVEKAIVNLVRRGDLHRELIKSGDNWLRYYRVP